MVRIELPVDNDNCIETVAKREYDSYLRRYLQKPTDELEEKTELLYEFLTSANFRELRKESEQYIMQGKQVKFIIYLEEGRAKYQLEAR